ncbi:hypothetical protein QBC46DRAFT_384304 [Diplogelasinospora grovesii]|uniref:Association with the SNF1 complex (ASC) domain-containing protein n=1 Tax=Diplogelasinospora grovesii TaxID=303347 RepID=A0AAN6N7X2_9PEZI|nr:hypothetical protein QBC46DRAFT_384304 [Diplogelasinospora grovesii]
MGNNPSTSKPGHNNNNVSSPSHGQQQHHESPRQVRRDNRHPIPMHNHRPSAAPPEPSLMQAQGTAVQRALINSGGGGGSNGNRPKSYHQPRTTATGAGTSLGNSPASRSPMTGPSSMPSPTRPIDIRSQLPQPQQPQHEQQQPQQQPPQSYSQQPANQTAAAATTMENEEPTKPVDVPGTCYPHAHDSPKSPYSDDEPSVVPHSSIQDMSYLTRPPRLPLPIEEEVHTPGSPIIAPADIGQPIDDIDGLDVSGLPPRVANLSNGSILDPDEEDIEELPIDKSRPTIPCKIEWCHGGDKIYLTGTIFQWNRKSRMHPVEGRPGVYQASVNILPGTHHVRFVVDGQMSTTPHLPTTVDFANNLVNYVEVSADDPPKDPLGSAAYKDRAHQAVLTNRPPPSVDGDQEESRAPKEREIPPTDEFAYKIPKYLLDFDQPEDTPAYQNAVIAIEKLPTPPSLPGFLGKPVLNAATLIKDDNSVLNMPNHTVLNHLATSSIKNNILAVSATTRYKNKYVTTIIYKPTTPDAS